MLCITYIICRLKFLERVHFCMIQLRVLEILENMGKTEYWLFKQMDMPNYSHFQKIINNKTSSIQQHTKQGFFISNHLMKQFPSCLITLQVKLPQLLNF